MPQLMLLFCLILFLLLNWIQAAKKEEKFNPLIISKILDHLTNTSRYDKRLRPMYGEQPIDVGITLHISSISAISEADMDFTLDFYLRQTWKDSRLAFGELGKSFNKIKSLTVGVDYLQKLFQPDTFFPSEKKSYFHITTTHNSFLRIDSDGTVFTSQRLTVTSACPMDLKWFPLDYQTCKLEIESYGYDVSDISYTFLNGRNAVTRDKFEMPQFSLIDLAVKSNRVTLTSGTYSRLAVLFLFKRSIGYYIIQIYVPAILIVVISYVSFWVPRNSVPSRVTLSVTTVLTITTLTVTTSASNVKVSYVKALDIYLGFCFLMVFASLLEYAALGYLIKRKKLISRRKESKKVSCYCNNNVAQNMEQSTIVFDRNISVAAHNIAPRRVNGGNNSVVYQRNEEEATRSHDTSPLFDFHQRFSVPNNPKLSSINGGLACTGFTTNYESSRRCFAQFNVSNIDKWSRIIAPIIFAIFNIIYWTTFLSIEDVNWKELTSSEIV